MLTLIIYAPFLDLIQPLRNIHLENTCTGNDNYVEIIVFLKSFIYFIFPTNCITLTSYLYALEFITFLKNWPKWFVFENILFFSTLIILTFLFEN